MGQSRRAGLLAAVFGSGLVSLFAGPAMAETLADAIALAYQTNPTILTQRTNVQIADERYYQSERTIGPSVTASVSVSGSTGNDLLNGGGSSSSARASGDATANQTIYSGGRLTSNLAAQEAVLKQAREQLRQTEITVLQSVVDAYTGVLRAQEALRISQDNVDVLIKAREEAQTKFEVGSSTRTDVAQSESRLAQARSQLTTNQNTLDNARAQYRSVVGKMPEDLAPTPSLAPFLPQSQALAFETAEQNNPALRNAYLRERQSAAQVASQRAVRRPQVTFSAGIVYNQSNPAFGTSFSGPGWGDAAASFNTTTTLSIPLYTGLTTSSQIRAAEKANQADNIGIESQRRTLNQSVTQSWNGLVSARALLTSQEEAVRAANLAYEGTREEQQVGLRTTLDLLNAQQELRSTQLTLINARFAEYTSQVNLISAMGTLTPETFGAQVEKYDPKKHFEEVNSFSLPWEPIVKTIDRFLAPPIPERTPLPGENVPTQEPLR